MECITTVHVRPIHARCVICGNDFAIIEHTLPWNIAFNRLWQGNGKLWPRKKKRKKNWKIWVLMTLCAADVQSMVFDSICVTKNHNEGARLRIMDESEYSGLFHRRSIRLFWTLFLGENAIEKSPCDYFWHKDMNVIWKVNYAWIK